jgi:predicted metal-dependent enzyme (double-stranded beta helix superfamily)
VTVLSVPSLVDECRLLAAEHDAHHRVATYLSQLLCDHLEELAALLGDGPDTAVLHRSADLTVLKVVTPPLYAIHPHDHLMWAVVGTVVGREDNTFFVRDGDHLEPTTGAAYEAGQVGVLDEAVIHAVRNPARAQTVGLHVYGGDLLAAPATEWDPGDAGWVAKVRPD